MGAAKAASVLIRIYLCWGICYPQPAGGERGRPLVPSEDNNPNPWCPKVDPQGTPYAPCQLCSAPNTYERPRSQGLCQKPQNRKQGVPFSRKGACIGKFPKGGCQYLFRHKRRKMHAVSCLQKLPNHERSL